MKDNKVEPETIIHRHVADAREGREARVVTRVYSGWVLFGQQLIEAAKNGQSITHRNDFLRAEQQTYYANRERRFAEAA